MSTYDPIDERGQIADKREQDARKQMVREQEISDIAWLMSSRRGRRIMWRMLDLSGPFRLSFDTNAMRMAFNEGNRNLGNKLLGEVMTISPEMYPAMMKEQQDGRDGNGKQSN
jgi:hypothetical protein